MDFLAGLNPSQQDAVSTIDGPVLTLAGPGSGKTRALTHRIAYLVREHQVPPWHILAVTFTNKAAREMAHRLQEMLSTNQVYALSVGTFHSLCARWLRREVAAYGNYGENFVIYDSNDQLALVKRALRDLDLDEKRWRPQSLHHLISNAKNEMMTPDKFRARTYQEEIAGRVYERYQQLLIECNAMDFDDLLLVMHNLFRKHDEVLLKYQTHFHYVMIDEFQDTNMVQYQLAKQLAGGYRNLFAVGDIDQCVVAETQITRWNAQTGAPEQVSAEQIAVGDQILAGRGATQTEFASVQRVYKNKLRKAPVVTVATASGKKLTTTPEHIYFANYLPDTILERHVTYLMYRQNLGYRVGVTTSKRKMTAQKATIGFQQRLRQERADAIWGLESSPRAAEAKYYEQLYTQLGAQKLLHDKQMLVAYPHHLPKGMAKERRRTFTITICADSRGQAAGHRYAVSGSDLADAQALEAIGIMVRDAKELKGDERRGWRVERQTSDLAEIYAMYEQVKQAVPVTLKEQARLTDISLEFCPASHVREGMMVFIRDADNRVMLDQVVAVEQSEYTGYVYDFDIEQYHNFCADGIFVHNSIYSWRGADYRNVLQFRKDYPDHKLIKLSQNYRSTETILTAAKQLIRQNENRIDNELFTERGQGKKITLMECYNAEEEARYILNEIRVLTQREGVRAGDIAIMYRTNAQSRVIEEAFISHNLPYVLVRGTRFYDRREIKDALAYLRLVHNPDDQISMSRIINVPPRAIGAKTIASLDQWAFEMRVTPRQALYRLAEGAQGPFSARASKALSKFAQMLHLFEGVLDERNLIELFDMIMARSGYRDFVKDGTEDGEERWENLLELRNAISQYGDQPARETLGLFLENVALVSDSDALQAEGQSTALLTLHAAKGLEFPVVFLVGMEEGILPHSRSIGEADALEEERRLLYVGVTRAENKLYITHAFRRRAYNGMEEPSMPSRFLSDLSPDLVDIGNLRARSSNDQKSRRNRTATAPSQAEAKPLFHYKAGDKVRHAKFGDGVVVNSKKEGSETYVTVAFEGKGVKKLATSFAKLERR